MISALASIAIVLTTLFVLNFVSENKQGVSKTDTPISNNALDIYAYCLRRKAYLCRCPPMPLIVIITTFGHPLYFTTSSQLTKGSTAYSFFIRSVQGRMPCVKSRI